MASMVILVGPPTLISFVLAPCVQAGLRAAGAKLPARVLVELGLVCVGYGLFSRKPLFGPTGWVRSGAVDGFADSDHFGLYFSTTLILTGIFTLVEGVIINIAVAAVGKIGISAIVVLPAVAVFLMCIALKILDRNAKQNLVAQYSPVNKSPPA